MTTISNATETHRALVEELYAALAEGDVECISALLAPDFVGRLTPGLPFGIGGEHVGAAAMIRDGWFRFGEHWRVRTFPESFAMIRDGRLQVLGAYKGRGRVSGRSFVAPYVHLFEIRDGRIAGLTQFTDSAAFVDALGDARPLRTKFPSADAVRAWYGSADYQAAADVRKQAATTAMAFVRVLPTSKK